MTNPGDYEAIIAGNVRTMNVSTAVRDSLDALELRNAHASPLLRLPAEIRNEIYAYVLTTPSSTYDICFKSQTLVFDFTTVKPQKKPRHHLAILYTCMQTYRETRLLPFSLNILRFWSCDDLQQCLEKLHPRQRLQIQRVEIIVERPTRTSLTNMQAAGYESLGHVLPNVDTVHLRFIFDVLLEERRRFLGEVIKQWRQLAFGPLREWLSGGERSVNIVENVPWYMEDEQ